MIVYKLTTEQNTSHLGYQWTEGVDSVAPGGGQLCSEAWLHAYSSPELAAMMSPIHVGADYAACWECDADVGIDDGTKLGCTRIRPLRRVPLPQPTVEQRVEFAIRCALAAHPEKAGG